MSEFTSASAKMTDFPDIEPIAFGIQVLVKCGLNNSWSWSLQIFVTVVFLSRNVYEIEFKKLYAKFLPSFGLMLLSSSTKCIKSGGKTIIYKKAKKINFSNSILCSTMKEEKTLKIPLNFLPLCNAHESMVEMLLFSTHPSQAITVWCIFFFLYASSSSSCCIELSNGAST